MKEVVTLREGEEEEEEEEEEQIRLPNHATNGNQWKRRLSS